MDALRKADCSNKTEAEQVASTECSGSSNLHGRTRAVVSPSAKGDCGAILHSLNNVLAGILLNAQVMEWKLPSYSRSRRYLHEIERNAQRGGELVKRLLASLEAVCPTLSNDWQTCPEVATLAGGNAEVATQVPMAVAPAADLASSPAVDPAPGHLEHRTKVPHTIV